MKKGILVLVFGVVKFHKDISNNCFHLSFILLFLVLFSHSAVKNIFFAILLDCVADIILQLKSHCSVSPAADCKIFAALLTANSICI